jgi:hypothetical protein
MNWKNLCIVKKLSYCEIYKSRSETVFTPLHYFRSGISCPILSMQCPRQSSVSSSSPSASIYTGSTAIGMRRSFCLLGADQERSEVSLQRFSPIPPTRTRPIEGMSEPKKYPSGPCAPRQDRITRGYRPPHSRSGREQNLRNNPSMEAQMTFLSGQIALSANPRLNWNL